MDIAIIFVGQLRSHSATWASLNRTFGEYYVYVSMWRPLINPAEKCLCFEHMVNIHEAKWLDPKQRQPLAKTLISDQMNIESFSYSVYRGLQLVVDKLHNIIACVRADIVYSRPISFQLREGIVFGARSRFGKHKCTEMPDERFFYGTRATMLRVGSFYVHLDEVHRQMQKDPGYTRWPSVRNSIKGNITFLNNPEGLFGRYLQWMHISCAVVRTPFIQVRTEESRWFHRRAVRFNGTCE